MRTRALVTTLLAAAGLFRPALADDPRSLLGGRLRLGGEASFALAADDLGFFNYTDYRDSYIRMVRLGAAAEMRLSDHISVLGDVRTYNFRTVKPYALYVRMRPWAGRHVDVQVGRIPPVFGAFARRQYGSDNPVIGLPQAYQYLTSIRTDAVPATADDLVRMRGEGWLVRYPIGNRVPAAGVPLVASLQWDTGAQVRIGSAPFQFSAAITQGTLGQPLFRDDNDGKQLSGHVSVLPLPGLVLGASAARGEYLGRPALAALPPPLSAQSYDQTAWGGDVEYSRGHWVVRSEVIWSEWDMPAVSAPLIEGPLRARAAMVEGRYKLMPGLWLAARFDDHAFTEIDSSSGRITWEAPVRRFEVTAGYALHRYVHLKVGWQRNRRDGGEVHAQDFLVGQVLLWY